MNWDKEVDILVVGSGAGGLLSALVAAENRAEVLIVEKEKLWGGTSATSGAGIWIPGSDNAKEVGFKDNKQDAFAYVRALSSDNVPDENIRAYVDNAADMLRWMQDKSSVRYAAFPYPDYHAENPGGSPTGYRTHLPLPMEDKYTDPSIKTLRHPSPAASLFGYINWDINEAYTFLFRPKFWWMTLTRMLANYWLDLPFRFTSDKDRRLTQGNALTGALRLALNDHNVPLWLESPMRSLIKERGKVIGAVINQKGKEMNIRAHKGVILAAGGFDKNDAMRGEHAPLYQNALYSGGTSGNTGDSIRAGKDIGAKTMNMHSAWAAPVWYVPGEPGGRLCTMERALPGGIMVNQSGERYLNEAASYHIVGQQMARQQQEHGNSSPSWFVFDADYRRKYPAGPLLPVLPDWLQRGEVQSIMEKAKTIGELAQKINIDASTLEETVNRFNNHAKNGEDPDFHRGEAAYDKMYGDPSVIPNPCLAAIEKGPFYAMPIYPGDIGTNGGLKTDASARVVNDRGKAIGGLYAIGNNAASSMGESYPGAGVTIGPALTFGYIATRDALGINS